MTASHRPNDPLFEQQWYLRNVGQTGGTAGIDLNVTSVWQDYTGAGVNVAIVDDGVDAAHPDLDDNYNRAAAIDSSRRRADGSPVLMDDNHGTAVAGLVAAERNAEGGVGVAYEAKLSSLRLDFTNFRIADTAFALRQFANFDVVNNSWGFVFPFADNFATAEFAPLELGMQSAVEKGRDGLGTVIVFAGGNSRQGGDQANYHNLQNSRYSIAVAALNDRGDRTFYSSPGANLLVSAFGGDTATNRIVTTDRLGRSGYTFADYTNDFGGTSAAAPMVAGVVALMLEANPNLGYRDVQEILAYSARQTDRQNPTWQTNGATNWNGGGLRTSLDYGFGLVDAQAAVRLAETWTQQQTAGNERQLQGQSTMSVAIRDNASASSQVTLTGNLTIDQVEVTVDIDHSWIGDLELVLISPNGTASQLMSRPGANSSTPFGLSQDDLQFTFSSTQFWGEAAAGNWTLRVRDRATGDTGTLKNWSLRAYGDAPSINNTYIYTNSFATVSGAASRRRLADTKGFDTLNAAAVSGDLRLDLRPGRRSRIADRSLSLTPTTQIEAAIGGDGADRVWGNAAANRLSGGRGADRLLGRQGDDRMVGGAGADRLYGGAGNDHLLGASGKDILLGGAGADTLTGGGGSDRFWLSHQHRGMDTLTDFVSGTDTIELSRTEFPDLSGTPGQRLQAGEAFAVIPRGAAATSAAQLVYNAATGALFYNPNGAAAGFGGGGQVAQLEGAPTLTARDVILQA